MLLTARIDGPETEEWYCPKVEWLFPDDTKAVEESDCAPFEKRHECAEDQDGCGWRGFRLDPVTQEYVDIVKECPCTITGYPRIWRRGICAFPGDRWVVEVRLSKSGKTIAKGEVTFIVKE